MKLYIVIHYNRFGTDVCLVQSDHFPELNEVIKARGIDYEPDRDEWIEIEPAGGIVTIP
jgi:hypothetical protein